MKNEIEKIKALMMQSLEEIDCDGVVQGDFICHEDTPDECPPLMDAYFTAVGDDPEYSYVVMIKKVKS
jgi:hypothetical protein